MRTVKRVSVKLNKKKFKDLIEIAKFYSKEKQVHLKYFQTGNNFGEARNYRQYRDELRNSGYKSSFTLQVRRVNCAIKDAFETELKYWASIAVDIKPRLFNLDWTDEQRHYGFWLLKIPQRLATLICDKAPINEEVDLGIVERKQVQNYLRRVIRRKYSNRPTVRLSRSFTCDAQMYFLKNIGQKQVCSISSLIPRNTIKIPLTGFTNIYGEFILVLNNVNKTAEIHTPFPILDTINNSQVTAAIDIGTSEVFVDDEGSFYGLELGEHLKQNSIRINDNGKNRNKLHQIAKKTKNKQKARNIKKFNLGKKKLIEKKRICNAESARIINTSINQLLKNRNPKLIISEKLDFRGKAKNKRMSRIVNLWPRTLFRERLNFKASVAGCNRQEVNPAYTSQICNQCGYLEDKNRKGDIFHCLKCGQGMHADVNASLNLLVRAEDKEILVRTPVPVVKRILQDRYNARFENIGRNEDITVSGQTLALIKPDKLSSRERNFKKQINKPS